MALKIEGSLYLLMDGIYIVAAGRQHRFKAEQARDLYCMDSNTIE